MSSIRRFRSGRGCVRLGRGVFCSPLAVLCPQATEAIDAFLFPAIAIGIGLFAGSIFANTARNTKSYRLDEAFGHIPEVANFSRNCRIACRQPATVPVHLLERSIFAN